MAELVAKRYGIALFELAIESDAVDQMEEEVRGLITVIEQESDLLEILSHPQVTTEDKEKLIEEIFASNVSDHLIGLLDLVIKKGRQGELLSIFNYFLNQVDAHHNKTRVLVTTVEPLKKKYKEKLITKLEDITKKQVILEESIDKSLIGGMLIRIGDRIIDNTIKGQMRALALDLYHSS